ncbi:unnamed protein product [Penicillium olsonii]|nr:unnamed protein product [Penicillium olsonii]CAG7931400.1 unnamed protein product [Penicillium olsonii]
MSNDSLSVYSCSFINAEDQMAYICLRFLSMEVLNNVDTQTHPDLADFLEYSAIYWADHVREMSLGAERKTGNLLDCIYNAEAIGSSPWVSILWRHIIDSEGNIPALNGLHIAALSGHQKIVVRLLLKDQIDPNIAGTAGSYALTYASWGGHHNVVQLLIQHGAHANAQDNHFGGALLAACLAGHQQIAQKLLECGANPHAEDNRGRIPLWAACMTQRNDIVRMLLNHGADVNSPRILRTAIVVADFRKSAEPVQMMLEHGASINTLSEDPALFLLEACLSGNQQLLKLLLDHGVTLSSSNLAFIFLHANAEVVQILLENRAKIEIPGDDLVPAIEAAAFRGDEKIMHILLEHQATINNRHGLDSVLKLACSVGEARSVQMLLDYGANVNNNDTDETMAALNIACSHGNEPIVKILLAHGANVHAQSGLSRNNALQVASSTGNSEVVRLLLKYGADVSFKDGSDLSVLVSAAILGKDNIVRTL